MTASKPKLDQNQYDIRKVIVFCRRQSRNRQLMPITVSRAMAERFTPAGMPAGAVTHGLFVYKGECTPSANFRHQLNCLLNAIAQKQISYVDGKFMQAGSNKEFKIPVLGGSAKLPRPHPRDKQLYRLGQ